MKVPGVLLQSRATVENPAGETAYGRSFTQPVEIRCRVQRRRRLVRNASGEEIISEATIITDPTDEIELGAKVTLDNGVFSAVQVLRAEGLNAKPISQEVLLSP